MCRVSVIIPNYNQTRYVGQALQSVFRQTYHNYEIIVVDDGSTDNSYEVIKGFGGRVRYIRQENRGLASARNTGIIAAQGELISLLDADDQWSPTYLETMISLINKFPSAAVYYCLAHGMDIKEIELPQIFGGPIPLPEKLYSTLLKGNFINACTITMRRSVVIKEGLFDPMLKSCEDWDLWLRLSPKYEFIGIKEYLVRYRIHGSSLSTDLQMMQQATRTVVEKHFGLEDEDRTAWSEQKHKAFGGLYRFCLLSSIQRKNDWQSGVNSIRQALLTDPTLAKDLDMFYELALGNQPIGYRGSDQHLDLSENAKLVEKLLYETFTSGTNNDISPVRNLAYGTAYYALGLVAYNTGDRRNSRRYLCKALTHNPALWRDSRVTGTITRSFLNPAILAKLKKIRRKQCEFC